MGLQVLVVLHGVLHQGILGVHLLQALDVGRPPEPAGGAGLPSVDGLDTPLPTGEAGDQVADPLTVALPQVSLTLSSVTGEALPATVSGSPGVGLPKDGGELVAPPSPQT